MLAHDYHFTVLHEVKPLNLLFLFQADGGNLICIVDDVEHNISVWDWAKGEKGQYTGC